VAASIARKLAVLELTEVGDSLPFAAPKQTAPAVIAPLAITSKVPGAVSSFTVTAEPLKQSCSTTPIVTPLTAVARSTPPELFSITRWPFTAANDAMKDRNPLLFSIFRAW
jgi:hypothetical protein